MNIKPTFCSLRNVGAACIVLAGIVAQDVQAMPLSWDFQVASIEGWTEQIQVTNSEGATATVSGYGTTGPGFTIERALVNGFGRGEGIGVCNNNEVRRVGPNSVTCAAKHFINRSSVLDASVYDLALIEFDQTMSGRLSLLIGGPGSVRKSNNYWFGRGPSSDLIGLTFDDLTEQYDHMVTGHNAVNGFGFNHPFPESGEEYDWVLLSPGGLGQRFLLSGINGTAADPTTPGNPISVSSPATYSLFAFGTLLVLLGTRLRRSRGLNAYDVEGSGRA